MILHVAFSRLYLPPIMYFLKLRYFSSFLHQETINLAPHKSGMILHRNHPLMVHTHNPGIQEIKAGW